MSENIGILSTPDGTGASIKALHLQDESLTLLINNQAQIQTNITDLYKSIEILSDTNTWDKTGSAICLRSKYAESISKGTFEILSSDGENRVALVGWPNKNLTWDNKFIDTIYSFGSNYIQYTNGLGICWGKDIRSNVVITFPIIFIEFPSIVYGYSSNSTAYRHIQGHNASTTGFTMAIYDENNTLYNATNEASAEYIAIGRWK